MMPVRRLFSSSLEGNQNNNDHHIPPELRQHNPQHYHHHATTTSSHLDAIGEDGNTSDDDENRLVNTRSSLLCHCNTKGDEEENEGTRRRILLLRVGVGLVVLVSIIVAIAITLTFVLDTDGGGGDGNLSGNSGKPSLHPPPGGLDDNNNIAGGTILLSMTERRKMEHLVDILTEYDIAQNLIGTLPPRSNNTTWFWKSSTPQQQALQWLATKDRYFSYDSNDSEYDPSSYKSKILQRYAMVVLYYSTNGRNTWYHANELNFLSTNTSICEWNINSTSTLSNENATRISRGSARRNSNGAWCDESGSVVNLYLGTYNNRGRDVI